MQLLCSKSKPEVLKLTSLTQTACARHCPQTLARFELDHMQAECLECCEDDGLAAAATVSGQVSILSNRLPSRTRPKLISLLGLQQPQRYAKAVLEMCRCKMGAYPQIVRKFHDGGGFVSSPAN